MDDDVVREALDAIDRRDWATLRLLLHPYLRWTEADVRIRGRTNVLLHLAGHSAGHSAEHPAEHPAARPATRPPESYELRDGQIYRWTTG